MACVQGFSIGDTRAPTPPSAPTLPHPSVFPAMCLMAMSQQDHDTDPLHAIYACLLCVYARVRMPDYLPAKQTMHPPPTPVSTPLCVRVKKIALTGEAMRRHTQAHMFN